MQTITSITALGINERSRVLMFMPHPDDEAVGSSGLLVQAATLGASVRVVTCTEGEGSTLRHGLAKNVDLASARKIELQNAVKILGVDDLVHWNLPDGGLEHSTARLQKLVLSQLSEYLPTDVFTLEPDGIYGHPDHIALTKIVKAVIKAPTKLWYVTVAPWYSFPSAIHMARKASIKPIAAMYQLKLSFADIWLKYKALAAHRSQFKLLPWQGDTFWHFWQNSTWWSEFFTRG